MAQQVKVSGIVTAVMWVQSLARELTFCMPWMQPKKKKKKKKKNYCSCFILQYIMSAYCRVIPKEGNFMDSLQLRGLSNKHSALRRQCEIL